MSFLNTLTVGVPLAILLLVVIQRLFRNGPFVHWPTWIRALLLIQAFISIAAVCSGLISGEGLDAERIQRPYAFAYIFMMVNGTLVPLVLLHRKLGRNIWILFVVSVLMNGGRFFESVVVMLTAYHRDAVEFDFFEYLYPLITIALIWAIAMISVELIIAKYDRKNNNGPLNKKAVFVSLLFFGACASVYVIAVWLRSLYGLDPPYGYFFTAIILEHLAIVFAVLFTLHLVTVVWGRKITNDK
ncbi:MAG TPA: hypothetical protein VGD40_24660 [Chryseosolibacter sp.]